MRAVVFASLLFIACGPKQTTPGASSTDYFPLADGASWTYQGSFNGNSSVETRYAVQDQAGGTPVWIFLLEEDLHSDVAAGVFTNMVGLGVYRRTSDGVDTAGATWRSDLVDLDPGTLQPMLSLPPQVGANITPQTSSIDRAGGWTVEAIEDLTVPAGTFEDCARLGLGQGSQAWFCPGVGLAKWIFVTGRVEELTAWSIPGATSGP